MIHEIFPHKFFNEFRKQQPKTNDIFIYYQNGKVLMKKKNDSYEFPRIADFPTSPCHYLFSIDELACFLSDCNLDFSEENYEFVNNRAFRSLDNHCDRLGGAVAWHIANWESLNKFCGRCGAKTSYSTSERAMVCDHCKNAIYPKISPVVIVAVSDGNRLLMARNLDHPDKSRLFLISGFVEIGESLEQAVEREVMEEAGIHVKNIKYFASQPWPFSDSLIAGFTAELDGDAKLHIQESEIETATWVNREDIPEYDTSVSISSCLIENFRRGK